ncbi:phenylacetate--CoA ligase family protein [Falsiroseomonas tokyonensis]|uniref:Phenylacetate--CoA ligase family protein n=1 Tax=Falsiroseomonas tokyonensis TaxID=430521 RepID=A0ABV7BYS5_9PROT|nr:phenylacetate--CoA ligase family protein [Falsiroseomonas tokyonensis]MBU8539586.1 phenylacetate--CoA ligase family protein [Falsiroseomonas tokyonensis]
MPVFDYVTAMDHPALLRDYPIGPDFPQALQGVSRDALRARQEADFAKIMAFGWKVPFYQRLWGAKGIEPGDIKGLDDLPKLPAYDKSDLMASVAAYPPLGDFHGQDAHPPERRPQIIFHTTSGTTGTPQPLLFGAKSREVQNRLLARMYLMAGMTRDDVVHSVYGHGMINGGHYIREAVHHWVGARFLSAGTGVETRSAQQIFIMKQFGATAIVGFADYIKRLSDVAREEGFEPGLDIPIRLICAHLGSETQASLSAAWGGAAVFDWYGVGDTGIIAGEGPDRSGMHIQEDAHVLEIADPDTGLPVPEGTLGDMICTCLFKDDIFPIIRFNTHDVTEEVLGPNPLGIPFRRMKGFLGRSDNMVKLRGINLFPTGIGALLVEQAEGATGEFICRVSRADGRDTMTAHLEIRGAAEPAMQEKLEAMLRMRLGVEIGVALCAPGSLAALTQVESRQKPIRLVDDRQ